MKVVKRLGNGGFGIVDLVEDANGNTFAKKTFSVAQNLPPQAIENVRRRFAREAKTQSGISHRNIVPVLQSDLASDPPSYLMPAALCSLQDDLDADKTLGGQWMRAIADVVAALDELHQMQIFHRDLKPQNVLRYRETVAGETSDFYAVSDFGLIAMNESRVSVLTVTGMAKGTDYYTAPEITSDLRRASAQSDIYSLGCILHEMIGTEPRVPCAEIKEQGEYGAILRNCTRSDPGRRFRSVRSVLDALISVSAVVPTIVIAKGPEFGDQLASGQPLDDAAWRALVDFVEDNEDDGNTVAILSSLAFDQISDLCNRLPDLTDRLGQVYSHWVRTHAFPFEKCDPVANILDLFVATASFETKADALMALLELGTSHNRWYVERKFANHCGIGMDNALARRLAVEFRAAGSEACKAIAHLERSVGITLAAYHPALQQTLREICP